MAIKFKEIAQPADEKDTEFLYELLKQRKFSISHKNLPSFESHKIFVSNYPYRKWFVISKNEDKIGSLYLTADNGVAINLLITFEKYFPDIVLQVQSEFTPLPEIPSVRRDSFFFNISPDDATKSDSLKALGFKALQVSYVKNR